MRKAFTIIEIFVSVMIISVVILGIAKIENSNISMARYISYRSANEFENTLFLPLAKKADIKNKQIDAYTAISTISKLKNDTIKETLKNIDRNVTVSDPIDIKEEELPIQIDLRTVMIKGNSPSRYYSISLGKAKNNQ